LLQSRPAPAPPVTDTTARLRVLATTDIHVHLLSYDYYADGPDDHVGLARTASLIAEARRECPNCLLLDNGDFLQGNPMGDHSVRALERGAACPIHPALRAMNRLRYDAATLGNHEFNYGLPVLEALLPGAGFPIVSANVARRLGAQPLLDTPFLPPYALLDRLMTTDEGALLPLRIGIIGFAPPQIVQWDRALLEGVLHSRGIVETAQAWVPRLRAAGAEIVIALSHSGIGTVEEGPWAENASSALSLVPGIDAIVAGHSHLLFPSHVFAETEGADIAQGKLHGKAAVMAGFHGSHLGVIDLQLRHADGAWQVIGSQGSLRAITPQTPPAPEILAEVRPDHEATVAFARRPVGQSLIRLHSHFATIAPCSALGLVAEAQASFVARELADRPEAALPILSAVSPFKAGGRSGPGHYIDIPPGELAMRHISDLYIFPNTIAALRLTGAELADWLELSMGLYRQIRPGSRDGFLIDDDFPCYNHDRIIGLKVEIDLSSPARYDRHGVLRNPAAQRVRALHWNGHPVDSAAEFVLVTNSYRAAGSGGYHHARPERLIDVGRQPVRDILLRHVPAASPIRSYADDSYRFMRMPGTTVLFDSAPLAPETCAKIAHLRPELLGPTPEGFARFRLHL